MAEYKIEVTEEAAGDLDFENEVKSLRESEAFQKFLDERSACPRRIPLEKVEQQTQREVNRTSHGIP